MIRKTRTPIVALAVCVAGTILCGAGQASAAESQESKFAAQGWATSQNVNGCPSTLHLLTPTQDSSFYAANPAALLPNGAKASSTDLRIARKTADAKIHWQTSLSCKPGKPGKPAPGGKTPPSAASSFNWSGYVSPRNGGYLGAAMEWVVPDAANSYPNTVSTSIWPGIGTGDSTADTLVQAGTESDGQLVVDEGGNPVGYNTAHYFWFELFPQEAEQEITNLTATPGDDVSALAEYDPETALAYFELADYTTGQGVYAYQQVTGSVVGSSSRAEWIAERPTYCFIGCNLLPLTNFGDLRIYGAQAAKGVLWSTPVTYPYVGQVNPDAWVMTDCGRTVLAQPGSIIDTTDFIDHWRNYGSFDGNPC
jgi:peptidase A4-like protein